MENQISQNNNIICSKENIILIKNKENDYRILLSSKNTKINFRNIINFNIYKILGEVNKKNIESCEMVSSISNNSAKFLFKFRALGLDIGIPKKYMFLETKCNQINNKEIEYISHSLDIKGTEFEKNVKGYEKITCHSSSLKIMLENSKQIHVDYNFHIDIHENLPIFATNLLGFLMKKMFLNLKLFIEKIE